MISGTSADGVDAALITVTDRQTDNDSVGHTIKQVAFQSTEYPEHIQQQLRPILDGTRSPDLASLAQLDAQLADCFYEAVQRICDHSEISLSQITAIGSHGQTLFHGAHIDPPCTFQIADPNRIAWHSQRPVVADFRRMDMAAGGQGAPLAPLIHQQLLQRPGSTAGIVNIGGIANITVLPAIPGEPISGYDTGPGNCLLDAWCFRHLQQSYDDQGQWAASGQVIPELLIQLKRDKYLQKQPPKSTGREYFNLAWLATTAPQLNDYPPADVQATLLQLSAETITDALLNTPQLETIYICGGGAHNTALMSELQRLSGDIPVASTTSLGVDPDAIEAILFAWLARQRMLANDIDTSAITGSHGSLLLGSVFQSCSV